MSAATNQLCREPGAELLGEGGFGQVWRFFSNNYESMVARKYFMRTHDNTEAAWFTIIQRLFPQHPNIIRMLASGEDNGHPTIELEYADDGTLFDLAFRMDANNNNNIVLLFCERITSSTMLRELVTGCLQGLRFLHNEIGILHNDIKPENILLQRGVPKLADLGLCCEKTSPMEQRIGTFEYIAPEVFAVQQEDDGKTDVFSLGLTFFEVFEGELPTPISREFQRAWDRLQRAGDNDHARSDKLRNEAKQFYNPSHFSSRLMDGRNTLHGVLEQDVIYMVAEMLRINVINRPTAARCLDILSDLAPRAPLETHAPAAAAETPVHSDSSDRDILVHPIAIQGVSTSVRGGSCILLPQPPTSAGRYPLEDIVKHEPQAVDAAVVEDTNETEESRMIRLVRAFASTGTCEDRELLTLMDSIRVKSNCRRNECAFRLLEVLHKYPESTNMRQSLFEAIAQVGKHWWHDHKKDRALLRAKYGEN